MPIEFNTNLEDNFLEEKPSSITIEDIPTNDSFDDQELRTAKHAVDLENDILGAKKEISNIDLDAMRGVKRTRGQICNDIKTLENSLDKNHKSLTKLSKGDCEIYLMDLMEQTGKRIQSSHIADLSNNIEANINANDAVKSTMSDLKQKIRMASVKTHEDNTVNPYLMAEEQSGAEFLYRANFLMLYGLEKLSNLYEDDIGVNIDGATSKLEEDKNTILLPIFVRIYRENADIIKQYASPLLELTFYNISLMGGIAAINLKKKRMSSLEKQKQK